MHRKIAKGAILLCFICSLQYISFAQWTELSSGVTQTFNDVFFINGSTGFAVGDPVTPGAEGLLLKTTDGGENWSQIPTGVNGRFEGIWFINSSTGFLVVDGGKVLKSIDQGATWNAVFDNSNQLLDKIYFANENVGYVIDYDFNGTGNYGLLKTTDQGATWDTVGVQFELINDLHFVSPDTGFVVSMESLSGHISVTPNGGKTWFEMFQTPGSSIPHCIAAVNADSIIAAGDGSIAWVSINTGQSWVDVPLPNQSHLEMELVSAEDIWIVGAGIIHTKNGGITWTLDVDTVGFTAVNFPNEDTGYAVGFEGAIYKYAGPCEPFVSIGSIAGDNAVCEGDTVSYSVPVVDGAMGYQWNAPPGSQVVSSNQNEAVIAFDSTSGFVEVTAISICDSITSSFSVTVYPLPPIPVIVLSNDTLFSSLANAYQWYLNGNPISGATNQFYVPTVNGNYVVLIFAANGCAVFSDTFQLISLGLVLPGEGTVILFPNPFSDVLLIDFSKLIGLAGSVQGPDNTVRLYITDLSGKSILQKTFVIQDQDVRIEVGSELSQGIYLLQVEQNNLRQVFPIVKQ